MKSVFKKFLELNPVNGEEKLSDEVFGIRMVVSSGYGDFGIASIVIIFVISSRTRQLCSMCLSSSPISIGLSNRKVSKILW